MYRSIDEFTKRRDEERRSQQKKNKPQFSVNGRGLDSFFSSYQDYYQEADEEDVEESQDDDDDPNLDDDMTQLSKDIEAEDADTEADEALNDVDDAKNEEDDDSSEEETPESQEEPKPSDTDDVDVGDDEDEDEAMKTFGQHGGDDLPNNQYDPKEIAKIMEFVADEAQSLSAYIEASKTSKLDVLQRLYSDIADEERYHMEQLLFAKSEICGEEYKPHDPDIRKEYEELISMGMDESDAMHTAVDKFNIRVGVAKIDDDGIKAAVQDIQESCDMLDQLSTYTDTIMMVYEHAVVESDADLVNTMNYVMSKPSIFQEDVIATVNHTYSNEYNPFRLLFGLIRGVNRLIHNIAKGIRRLCEMSIHRSAHMLQFIQQHGIGAVFASGPSFYLWNDKTATMDFEPVMAYVNRALWVTQDVIHMTGLRSQTASQLMNIQAMFTGFKNDKYSRKIPTVTAYKELDSLDPVRTKVIVTQNNSNNISNQFFGQNQNDQTYVQNARFDPYPPQGVNIYTWDRCANRMDVLIQATTTLVQQTETILGELEGLENDGNSIFFKNPRTFKNCADYMQAVVKGLQTLSRVFASDFQEINNLYDIIKNN